MDLTKPFLLFGAGGHGMVIAELVEAAGGQVIGFADAITSRTSLLDYPVYADWQQLAAERQVQVLVSIGNNKVRREVVAGMQLPFGTIVHPSAVISSRAQIGEGTVVMAGVCVNSQARIGKHVILNTRCSVDHECVLGDFVHLSPGVSLAGNVQVGEGTHIGTGASVIPGVRIGRWCTIGAGAVVIRDVPDGVTVVGVPGRVVGRE